MSSYSGDHQAAVLDTEEIENATSESGKITKDKDHTNSNENSSEGPYWTRDRIFAIVTFCCANFSVGAYYSILGPFFPQEAAKKEMNSSLTGLVFSCFEIVIIFTSPLFGTYLTKIGAKFLYISGLIVSGCTAILFGVLEYCPPGTPYIVMCFLVRSVEGLGTSAFVTASFAIIANTFPDRVASMIGNLELFTGIGLMIGPPLGGVLFQFGGFKLPFIVTGLFNIIIATLSIFLLPVQEALPSKGKQSIRSLLKIPVVLIMVIVVAAGTSCIGFIDVGLSIWLSDVFNFKPIIVGVIFLIGPGVYAFMSPIWGCFADKFPKYSIFFISLGYMIAGIGFIFMGPAPFIPIASNNLWLLILSLAGFGIGVGSLVASFQVVTAAAIESGMPEDLDTFGLVSGLFNVFFSIGTCIGPLLGGYLLDKLDFQWASFIFGCIVLFCTFIMMFYLIIKSTCLKHHQPAVSISYSDNTSETSPLVTESVSEERRNTSYLSYGTVEGDIRQSNNGSRESNNEI